MLSFSILPLPVSAQVKTTVTDNLVGPDGSPATGTMTITAAGSFESADGYNVAKGWSIQVPVSSGSFSVRLIPTQGATPPGATNAYTVTYNLTSSLGTTYWSETWFVPSTGPVGLAAVRTLPSLPASFLSPQSPNTVLAGPAAGSSPANAGFRTLVGADLPFPAANSLGGIQSVACANGQFVNQISTAGAPGCGTPGTGSVTSVGLSLPSLFSVTGSPVVGSGTLSAALASQSANQFFASPDGTAGMPVFRGIVAADIPTLNQNTTGNAATSSALASTPTQCSGSQLATGIAANGNANCATPTPAADTIVSAVATGSPYTGALGSAYSCNASSGAVTVNLPATTGSGKGIQVWKTDSSANACVVAPHGTDTIDGANSSYSITSQWAASRVEDYASGAWKRTHINQVGGDASGISVSESITNLSHVTNGSLANSGLANAATTVNGTTCTLGSTCTPNAPSQGPYPLQACTPDATGNIFWTAAAMTNWRQGHWEWAKGITTNTVLTCVVTFPHVLPSGTAKIIIGNLAANDSTASHTMTFETCDELISGNLQVGTTTCQSTQNFTTTTTAYATGTLTFGISSTATADAQMIVQIIATTASSLANNVQTGYVALEFQ